MSSILKALRKVEEEKRVATHAAPDLRSDQGAHERKKKTIGPLLTGMLLGAVCVSLILYAVSGYDEPEPVSVIVQEERAVAPRPANEPISVKPARETIPVVVMPPEPVPAEPSAPAISEPADAVTKQTVAGSPTGKPSSKAPSKTTQAAATIPLEPERSSLPAGVTLKVSEIFYQPDPADRMAVVNDLPVMVGTSVDDVLVSEIHSNHVLFRINGVDYPVYLPAQ